MALSRRAFLAVAGMGVGATLIRPHIALAAPKFEIVHVKSFDEVPLQTISLDRRKTGLMLATKHEATGELDYAQSFLDAGGYDYSGVTVDISTISGETKAVDGTFTALWENVGADATGAAVDVEMVLHDIRLYPIAGVKKGRFAVCRSLNTPNANTTLCSHRIKGQTGNINAVREKAHMRILRHGTNELATGNMNFTMRDVDVSTYNSDYPEGVRFISGFGSPIYVTEDTDLAVDVDSGWAIISIPNDGSGNDLPQQSVVAVCGPEFEIEWQGYRCATALFSSVKQTPAKIQMDKNPSRAVWL